MPWTTSPRSCKRQRRGPSRPRGPASPSAMSCTPRRRTGATRCCTSCCPIVSPTGRSTRDRCSTGANVSAQRAAYAAANGLSRVALGHLEAVGRTAIPGRHPGRHQEPASVPGESRGHHALDRARVPAARRRQRLPRLRRAGLPRGGLALRHAGRSRGAGAGRPRARHARRFWTSSSITRARTGSTTPPRPATRSGRSTPPDSTRACFPSNGFGGAITNPQQPLGNDDYVWPQDLQFIENYTRAGTGSLGAGDIRDPNAEHKRTDFEVLRDLAVERG